MFLHKFRSETFTEAPHGKPCEKIVILGIGLCLDSSYYIRDELADGKLHIRKIVGIRIFWIGIPFWQPVFIHQFQEYIGDFRIKLKTAVFADLFVNDITGKCTAVNTPGTHSVIAVSHGNDPCVNRNLFSGKSIRISIAIVTFVMAAGNFENMGKKSNVFQDLSTNNRVLLNKAVFVICKPGWFIQDWIRNTDLADIM